MATIHFFRRPWKACLTSFAFWTLIGLAFASQLYVSSAHFGNPISWRYAVSNSLADWYVFALLSVPAIGLSQRHPLIQKRWKDAVAIHFGASTLFSITWVGLRLVAGRFLSLAYLESLDFAQAFKDLLGRTFLFNLLIYWVIVTVSHALDYYRKYHERELRTSELEKRLAQAKLQALQMQLNPHFLFNTLHAISALMHKDVEAADRMIARLSDLLRYALESTDAQEVPLKQELDFLKRYLEIEQTRFGNRLAVQMEIAPETIDARVPNLVLQPLIENAIRHGIEPHSKAGRISLRATRDNETLVLQVRDNGAGVSNHSKLQEGIGLSNTRARLQELYGADHRFELNNATDGGLLVSVTIPWRT
jgi:sensor histidine kinase YesM